MKNKIFVGCLFVLLLSFSSVADAGSPQTRQPFNEAEFNRFMADYPPLSQWLTEKSLHQGSESNPWVMSGMRYNRAFIGQLEKKGWDVGRFFYLLDHINMGLLTSQAEAKRDAAREVMDEQRKKMQAQMAAGRQKLQEQMREQMRSSAETAQKQWAAQRERIAGDPYIPPVQKQRILAQMDRSKPTTSAEVAAFPSYQERQAQMRQQQQAWMAEQHRQVMNNPNIPPQQKKAILAQMERSMAFAAAPPPPPPPPSPPAFLTPEEMRAKRVAQQTQWLKGQMERVSNDGSLPPAYKKQVLAGLQRSLDQVTKSAERPQPQSGIIPDQENALIKNNRERLMGLFFPER